MRSKIMDKDTKALKRKYRILFLGLLLLAAAAAGTAVWALFFRDRPVELSPEHLPQSIDTYAEPSQEDGEEKMEAPEGGGAVSMAYQREVSVSLGEKEVSLVFENPEKSVNEMVLQLVLTGEEDLVIAQSQRLPPGYRIEKMDLLDVGEMLEEGEYEGKFHVLYYDPDTGEKAVVNGDIQGIHVRITP